jgi:hypothetical protein
VREFDAAPYEYAQRFHVEHVEGEPTRESGPPDVLAAGTGLVARGPQFILDQFRARYVAVGEPDRQCGHQQIDRSPWAAAIAAILDALGIADAHPLIVDMWHAVQGSVESRFFSAADWERLRWELWHANYAMTGSMSARACAAIQHGLNELLLSPAIKRRAGIELRPQAVDADAAVSMLGRYKQVLKSV